MHLPFHMLRLEVATCAGRCGTFRNIETRAPNPHTRPYKYQTKNTREAYDFSPGPPRASTRRFTPRGDGGTTDRAISAKLSHAGWLDFSAWNPDPTRYAFDSTSRIDRAGWQTTAEGA